MARVHADRTAAEPFHPCPILRMKRGFTRSYKQFFPRQKCRETAKHRPLSFAFPSFPFLRPDRAI
jgi:hypothetical protein